VEARIDADLQLGRSAETITELSALTAAHPLRERFHAQLMLACYRTGRQADALAAYRRARGVLSAELGIEPGPELRQLHQRILDGGPALEATSRVPGIAGAAAGPPAADAPEQLPPDSADFTGRDAQIRLLYGLLATDPDEGRPGAVVISAVAGMGGVGKTALAVHVGHQLRGRFPDGQLFASLQGSSSPLRPADVLAGFLRDLGVPDAAISAAQAERAARFRTLLAARRMLIVLDDARDAAQVRPLLPGTAGCAVIVTSRNTLPGLAGAALLGLDVLDADEARGLFNAIVGPQRAAAEPDATASVLACCAGLPLAVRIAASRLASRPGWSIAHLAGKLADEKGRLTELTAGDLAVRASFAVSYDTLPRAGCDPARVFRLLGLPTASVLSLPAIAALSGQPASEVAAALERLTDAHLLESPAPDRFRLHDLLRTYAAEPAEYTDSEEEREAAIHRMLRWYGEHTVTAARVLAPTGRLPASALFQVATLEAMTGPAQALDWYQSELANLTGAVRQAADMGMHDLAAQIAAAMWDFFRRSPHAQDWLVTSEIGVSSARHLGDNAVLSWLLNSVGQVHSREERFDDARRCFTEALDIRRRTGDQTGEAMVLNSLAIDLLYQERLEEALTHLRSALAIHAVPGDQDHAGMILNNIGHILLRLKRHDEALDHLRQALVIRHQSGDRYGEGNTESALGDVFHDLGRLEDAVEHYRLALAAHQDTARENPDHADVLCSLGSALDSLGRVDEARDAWRAAIPILDRISDPRAAELRSRLSDPANSLGTAG
jgi:tetratricopeptide (TPR) repeat protein